MIFDLVDFASKLVMIKLIQITHLHENYVFYQNQ